MFFQPTEEEIKKASEGGKVPFKDKTDYVFMFENVQEKPEDKKMIIETKVIGGEFDGRKHSFWFRMDNEYDRATLLTITDNFIDRAALAKQGFQFSTTIGNKFQAKAIIGKTGYTNFYSFSKMDSAPAVGSEPSTNDIPF